MLIVAVAEQVDVVQNELVSLWQRPRPFDPLNSLMQRRQPVVDIAVRGDIAGSTGRVSSNNWQNVDDPSLLYSIRDPTATMLPFGVISVSQVRLIPGREAETLKTLPLSSVIDGHVWAVAAFP